MISKKRTQLGWYDGMNCYQIYWIVQYKADEFMNAGYDSLAFNLSVPDLWIQEGRNEF